MVVKWRYFVWTGTGPLAIPWRAVCDAPPPVAGPVISARVAQLVEQRIENPRVGGSNPPPGTTHFMYAVDM